MAINSPAAPTPPPVPNTGSVLGDLGQWAANFNPAGLNTGPTSFATQGGQRGGVGVWVPPSTPQAPVTPQGPDASNWQAGTQAPGVTPTTTPSPFASDPGVADATAREQLGLGSINSSLQNLIAQRIASYGDASLASQAGFGLDPQAAAFTRQNYLTGNAELARLDHAHQLARQAIVNRLAGHGLLFSGETGYDTGQEDQQYGNNVYDAQQKALADILGYRTNALSQTQGLHSNYVTAVENAYQLALQHPELFRTGQTVQAPQSQTTVKPPAVKAATTKAVVARLAGNAVAVARQARG